MKKKVGGPWLLFTHILGAKSKKKWWDQEQLIRDKIKKKFGSPWVIIHSHLGAKSKKDKIKKND